MELTDIAWFFTALSMAGAALNAKGKKAGFYLWLITNSFFMYLDYTVGIYAQTALYLFFIASCIYGILTWKK